MIEMPVIDPEKCDGCGLCVDVCACGALKMINGVLTVIEMELCGWCLQCEIVCPTKAISCAFQIIIDEK